MKLIHSVLTQTLVTHHLAFRKVTKSGFHPKLILKHVLSKMGLHFDTQQYPGYQNNPI